MVSDEAALRTKVLVPCDIDNRPPRAYVGRGYFILVWQIDTPPGIRSKRPCDDNSTVLKEYPGGEDLVRMLIN